MRVLKGLAPLLVMLTMVFAIGGTTPQSDAASIFIFPNFFPPFADSGTVVELTGDGETCLAWRADSNSALYFFNGLSSFAPGDRLFVSGKLCTICLVTLTCGQPVSPILNAKITPLW